MNSVCILVQNYYEIDIRVRRKAEALVAAGYTVDVLALQSSFTDAKSYALNGVTVHTLELGKRRGSLARYCFEYLLFLFWASYKLWRLMGTRHYEVIDVNNLPDFLVFAGAYAKWRGAKIVFDMHEITPEFYISKYGIRENSWLVRLLKRIEKASFDFADHVLTINEPIRKLLEQRGLPSEKCTVIMNSVDEELFAEAIVGGAAPAEGAPAFVMMYHGTLTRIYGLDIALEAFGRVHQSMPRAEFWILGNGPEKSRLQALAQELGLESKVRFIGPVLPQEVTRWLSRCSVGVLATRRDVFLDFSFSNKLSEYIVLGKAVIASRLKAIRHYFSEDALAFFEPQDAVGLASQMMGLYKQPALCQQLAQRARREYAPIAWTVMKERYLDLMTRLVRPTLAVTPVGGVSGANRVSARPAAAPLPLTES